MSSIPNEMGEAEPTEGHHMVRGSAWNMAIRWSLRLSGLLSTVILARLLTPADYGVVAIAMLIVGMIELLTWTGQDAAVIRHPNPTREHYDANWTVSLLLGLGLGLIVLAATPLATLYFKEPRAVPVVAILAFRTMMLGMRNVGVLNFRRNLQFRKQFWYIVIPKLFSLVITIVSAFILRNYWALIIGVMGQHVCAVVLSYTMEPFRPRISFVKVREIWSYSIWTLIRNIGTYVNDQVDKFVIGGFSGAASMGRYEVARDVAISPTQEIITPVVVTILPVMARVQFDHDKRREIYLNVLNSAALICTSTAVGVALVAEDMADLMLGPQWHDVSILMPWFALSWGLLGMCSSVYSAFDTIGRAYVSARLQWMRVACLAAAIVPVAYLTRNLEDVAITRLVVTAAVTPALFYALSRALNVKPTDLMKTVWRPVAASIAMAVAVLGANATIAFTGPPRLALDIVLGATTYSASIMLLWYLVGRPSGPERLLWERLRPYLTPLRRMWT